MNSEIFKENIKPLRGGRNAAQLEVVSQAQTNEELYNALHIQQQQFHHDIEKYEGNDPLEIWYEYISWVEQSYPKCGREGNLVSVLEECIMKFENGSQYSNDRRFCKIWIKYIDMQSNPLELFNMLYAKKLCIGCADLYKAWAFYHELNGDYRNASSIYITGQKELAQPASELDEAFRAMVFNAGQYKINGITNELTMEKQRQALTQLSSYKPGMVGSNRVGSVGPSNTLPTNSTSIKTHRQFHPNVHVEAGDHYLAGVETYDAAPASILSLVKKDAPNENMITAGVWNATAKGPSVAHKIPSFKLHDDNTVVPSPSGINYPDTFQPHTFETYIDFVLPLCYPDPPDDNKKTMYPKDKVYECFGSEYSLEEIKSRTYKIITCLRLPVDFVTESKEIYDNWNTPFFIHDIEDNRRISLYPKILVYQFNDEEFSLEEIRSRVYLDKHLIRDLCEAESPLFIPEPIDSTKIPMYPKEEVYRYPSIEYSLEEIRSRRYTIEEAIHVSKMEEDRSNHSSIGPSHNMTTGFEVKTLPMENYNNSITKVDLGNQLQHETIIPMEIPSTPVLQMNFQSVWNTPVINEDAPTARPTVTNKEFQLYESPFASDSVDTFKGHVGQEINSLSYRMSNSSQYLQQQTNYHQNMNKFTIHEDATLKMNNTKDINSFTGNMNPDVSNIGAGNFNKFAVHEDTTMGISIKTENTQNRDGGSRSKGISMKTPLKCLMGEEFAETGSRGGLDYPIIVEQIAESKSVNAFQDAMNSSDTVYFDIKDEKQYTSTPSKMQNLPKLNAEYRATSVDLTQNRPPCNPRDITTIAESSYENNLAENSLANAELRKNLLNNLMGYENSAATVSNENAPDISDNENKTHVLDSTPSDPFSSSLIDSLLKLVQFPGMYRDTYQEINTTPRIAIRKDTCYIGGDKYIIEKCLGKGAFGSVFKATRLSDMEIIALKFQKPANKWEYYICKELQKRLENTPSKNNYMQIHYGYFSEHSSVLISDFNQYGSLLGIANTCKQKSGKPMHESLCIHFCIEMLRLVQTLHQVKIIHADIKPDNFLVIIVNDQISLQLIDFGCSIDMSLFPEGTQFSRPITTENFICCEMRENRSWSYHTDLFCVAASAHALLFDKYIEVQNKNGSWSLTQRFARYLKLDLWNTFFDSMLNQTDGRPNIEHLLLHFRNTLNSFDATTRNDAMRSLKNIILNR